MPVRLHCRKCGGVATPCPHEEAARVAYVSVRMVRVSVRMARCAHMRCPSYMLVVWNKFYIFRGSSEKPVWQNGVKVRAFVTF